MYLEPLPKHTDVLTVVNDIKRGVEQLTDIQRENEKRKKTKQVGGEESTTAQLGLLKVNATVHSIPLLLLFLLPIHWFLSTHVLSIVYCTSFHYIIAQSYKELVDGQKTQ